MALSSGDVLPQHTARGGVYGNEPIFAELTATDGQHARVQVDVLELEITCFADAKTRDAEKSKQAVVNPWQQ